jgi:hypothetical protein
MGKANPLCVLFVSNSENDKRAPMALVCRFRHVGLHESMNLYSHMIHGQGLKVPHPMVADYHEYLGRYLRMEISNEDAFMAQIYPARPAPQGEQEPPQRRRRIHDEEGPLPFPMPPPMNMIRAVLEGFGIVIGEVDLSAPGRVDDKPEPEEVKPLGEAWEEIVKKPEKIDGMPNCQLCEEYSATIVMVPCGCRYGCDDCFRKFMNSTTIPKACIWCTRDFKTAVRMRN